MEHALFHKADFGLYALPRNLGCYTFGDSYRLFILLKLSFILFVKLSSENMKHTINTKMDLMVCFILFDYRFTKSIKINFKSIKSV